MDVTHREKEKRSCLYEHKIRRERREFKFDHFKVDGPNAAGMVLVAISEDLDREYFYSIYLNVAGKLIGYELVAVGGLADVLVHPREVFRGAILAGAYAIVVGHNHPSGNPEPSPDDIALTVRLAEVGKIVGIEVLDSIVIANGQVRSVIECLKSTS